MPILGTSVIIKTTACKLAEKKLRKKIDYSGSLHRVSPISRKIKGKSDLLQVFLLTHPTVWMMIKLAFFRPFFKVNNIVILFYRC